MDNLILSLSCKISFHEALKISSESIIYPRLKFEYKNFINNYLMYNFDIIKSTEEIKEKFEFYEFNMFLSIIIDCQKEGNYVENLEAFSNTLEMLYFKSLKYNQAKRILFISFATIISLINILVIVMYPIILTVLENMTYIFK